MKKMLLIAAAAMAMTFQASAASTAAAPGKSYDRYEQFKNPDSRYRPFVRWWWNGDRVEAEELVRELHLLKDAGIAGVEINPISFPSIADTIDTKELKWLSDEWIDMVKTVFDEASRIGMTCDLIIGSGWPFGAENLPRDQRARVMLTYAQQVTGPTTLEISEYSIFKAMDPGVTKVNPRRSPTLVSAYLAPDPINDISEAIDVTGKFTDGVLTTEVPEGKWQLYAMVQYESFASVINGAPGAAGSILNHMDSVAVKGYLDHMADAIEAKTGPLSQHLRAFFVDSMELEGNNWTTDFAQVFKERRGYDLMPWLPFTMFKVGRLGDAESFEYGSKKGEKFQEEVNRVRFDFELTKAELLHERYTKTFLAWCKGKGVKSRAQAYGRGFFPLESSLGYDIPEGESWTTNWLRHRLGEEMGDEDYRRGRGYTMIDKYVSSAAHLTGKRIVSAEEMTNTYKVFSTTLELLKVGSDMSACAGTTHSVWHGFNYSPLRAPFPGWVQYGSFYNERNTWWPYWKLLNDYRARMSSILQNADMYTDIAILPANYDMWTTMGVQTEPFPVKLNIPYTSLIWEAVHKTGGGADYVSEIILNDATVKKGKLCYGPKQYGTLFLVEVSGITPETLDKLLEFVSTGGRVFCIGKYPDKSLGLNDYEARDKEVKEKVEKLCSYKDRFILLEKPADGAYLEWYEDQIAKYRLPHAITISNPDRFLLQNHYVGDDKADIFLFVNASIMDSKETDVTFPSSVTAGKHAWIYDPATGERWRLPVNKGTAHLKLGPAESYIVVFDRTSGGRTWTRIPTSGSATREVKNWKLSLHQPQENWTKESEMKGLKDLKDTEFKNFMGDVTYTSTVTLYGKSLPTYINLGKVADICELKVNGKDCGTKWFGERTFDVTGLLHEGENTIEVKVTTLMSNYMQTLKDNKTAQRYVLKRNTPLLPAGLIGPVTLYK